ncbi:MULTISPECIES: hypothetical protein [unclassified Streptomyces]|nr:MULTISPECIES: hypothetical protein [unclassified Streptomyces]MED7948677.1 hypothetical protein [Streptomyces sp. BE303]MEE1828381.1 hypothetical protein [Streptomyces sp. BE20]
MTASSQVTSAASGHQPAPRTANSVPADAPALVTLALTANDSNWT